jgi:hypothetical protein
MFIEFVKLCILYLLIGLGIIFLLGLPILGAILISFWCLAGYLLMIPIGIAAFSFYDEYEYEIGRSWRDFKDKWCGSKWFGGKKEQ